MPFRNACFISYRHPGQARAEAIINAFHDALEGLLALHLAGAKVFLDKERLKGGDFWNRTLTNELCHSACMVIIYNPLYFDLNYRFCAREFKAMVRLEHKRLASISGGRDSRSGLIIPVILRGESRIPEELRRRQYHRFPRDLLRPKDLELRSFLEVVNRIADTVAERYLDLQSVGYDPTDECASFKLPADNYVDDWLRTMVVGPPSFRGWTSQ